MLIPFEGDLEAGEDYEGLSFAEAAFDEAVAGGCHRGVQLVTLAPYLARHLGITVAD